MMPSVNFSIIDIFKYLLKYYLFFIPAKALKRSAKASSRFDLSFLRLGTLFEGLLIASFSDFGARLTGAPTAL